MLLSVITINYNNARGLEATIKSVADLSFSDMEYIVIDGGSTDGSVEVLKKYQHKIDHWVSEPDKGIYNAMNKGIERASGDRILMINSGDTLLNNEVITNVFNVEHSEDIIYGDLLWVDGTKTYSESFPEKLTYKFFRTNSLGHQAAFVKKKVHNIAGLYDEGYNIVSDWKFFLLAICKFNVSYKHIPSVISVCGRDGISCKPESWNMILAEKNDVFNKEFPAFVPDYIESDELIKEIKLLRHDFLFRVKNKLLNLFK